MSFAQPSHFVYSRTHRRLVMVSTEQITVHSCLVDFEARSSELVLALGEREAAYQKACCERTVGIG